MRWVVHLSAVGLCSVLASIASAVPTITSVSGKIADGSKITLKGKEFGIGPQVVLFDDFGKSTDGEVHNADAVVGKWAVADGIIFSDKKLSNGKGIRVVDDPGQRCSKVVFPEPATQVFTSFVGYVPDGWKFPVAAAEEQFPERSALKVGWLMNGDKGHSQKEESDFVLIGWTGKKFCRIGSNDSGGPSTFDNGAKVGWLWDTPVRWSYWIKGNGTNQTGTDGLFQATNGQEQLYNRYTDYKAWFLPSHKQTHWDRMNFVGYVRSASSFSNRENFVLDDIYIAIGPNAAARVEIGNAPKYTDCTKLTLVTTGATGDSWNDTAITATVRQGTLTTAELEGGYLYVTTSTIGVNVAGYPLRKNVK